MVNTIHDILGESGRIAAKLPGYELRPQQLEMAEAVQAAFDDDEDLLVEAGTGVGKSFAYLVPAVLRAIHHGSRVVVSTHTIALQEQLIRKDIPFLQKVLPEFSAVLVKGRANYIGLRRLARTSSRQDLLFDSKAERAELHRIEDWAYETTDGSRSDLSKEPNQAVWDRIRSDGDDCFGRKCPHYKRCFFQRARRDAELAQLLIVNHALLFSDLAMRRQGAAILPEYQYLILDEAHTVESVAGDHLGVGVSTNQVRYLLNGLHSERTQRGSLHTERGESLIPTVNDAQRCLDDYMDRMLELNRAQGGFSHRLKEPPPVDDTLSPTLLNLKDELASLRHDLPDEQDRHELNGVMERCKSLALEIEHWHKQQADGWVYWLETGAAPRQRVSLFGRPIDVGPALKVLLFDQLQSTVLTSATMTTGKENPFAYLTNRLSLEEARTLALGSPFDYRSAMTVYVEAGMPDPSNASVFLPAACSAIEKYLLDTQGRAFVLFTSYSMLNECAERLRSFFGEHDLALLAQGSGMPRSAMLDAFKRTERCVLFGTDTFWAGVDVPGEALSNVIITKLPFAVPNQPMIEARIEQIRESGGNPFMSYQVPEAVLKFKQGIGRLIRSKQDRGIVAVLDPRVVSKPYGRQFLDALPDGEIVMVGNGR